MFTLSVYKKFSGRLKEYIARFLDVEIEGSFLLNLLTHINHWDIDKERLLLITTKHLVFVKYDFITLRRLDCSKRQFGEYEGIVMAPLVYPSGS